MISVNIINNLKKAKREVLELLPLKPSYLNLRQAFARSDDQFPHVEWLSHHIPKTAGMSLKHSFRHAFGEVHFQEVYSDSYLPKRLSNGKPIWIPGEINIIHGHFRPHGNHKTQFPEARRIIWIRDPVERNISVLNHWLRKNMKTNKAIQSLRDSYANKKKSFAELFALMMDDKNLLRTTRIYETYLKDFCKEDFAFIGHVNTYKEDLMRLEKLMGVKLLEFDKNVKPTTLGLDIDIQYYRKKLQSEYDLLEKWK